MELVGRMRGALQLFADSHFERASDLLHVQKLVVETSVFDDRRVGEVECFEYTGVLIDVVLGTEVDFREGRVNTGPLRQSNVQYARWTGGCFYGSAIRSDLTNIKMGATYIVIVWPARFASAHRRGAL
jgi:hypothetical protein